jgi:hypothetical protein
LVFIGQFYVNKGLFLSKNQHVTPRFSNNL